MSARQSWPALLMMLALASCRASSPGAGADPGTLGGAAGMDAATPVELPIGQVQGRTARSPHLERQVSIQGVVVGNFVSGLQGLFVQSERDDGDPLTAEGLFIEQAANALPRPRTGDRVRISGRVAEFGDAGASLTGMREVVIEVIGHRPLAATLIAQAPAVAADWERLEGMLLKISVPLTVSGNHGLTRYGEIVASFDGRLFQPVQTQAPGAAAMALAANNARRTLLLDDNRSSQDPRNLWILAKELSDAQPVRAGSVLRGVTGVLDQRRGVYRLQLVSPPEVQHAPRPPAPSVEGNVRIASLNLLNLFNGDGHGGGFPTQRGAETFELHQMQLRKLVATVQALAPDVAALMEVENDGSGPDSALAQFVQALNAAGPIRDYRLIDTGTASGSDDIRVAMVYRSSRVGLQGTVATLAGGPFEQRSRVPLAQAFRAGNGPVFVVAANHFKSKGCGRDEDIAQGAEADQQDGQSCWNPTRSDSAQRVSDWLKSDPTGTGAALQLILGDLNAYAMEDPLRLLRQAGWHDALSLKGPRETGEPGYSYVYEGQAGRLDHALVNAALLLRLRGAHEWHGNADEAPFFGYQNDREADPYRASDHDPLLLGFELER